MNFCNIVGFFIMLKFVIKNDEIFRSLRFGWNSLVFKVLIGGCIIDRTIRLPKRREHDIIIYIGHGYQGTNFLMVHHHDQGRFLNLTRCLVVQPCQINQVIIVVRL